MKKGYNLPHPKMSNTDLSRLLKSEEIKRVLRKPKKIVHRRVRRLNPLTNVRQMIKLNPYVEVIKRRAILAGQKRRAEREIEAAKRRGVTLDKSHVAVRLLKQTEERRKQIAKLKAKSGDKKKVAPKKK